MCGFPWEKTTSRSFASVYTNCETALTAGLKAGKMPPPEPAIAQRRDDLERFEFMMGVERGRLAVTLDMLTDALILIGQHGVYCASTRNPSKPALDLETVLGEINGAKELIQSVMEQLRLKNEGRTQP
jgi:hypothetical protein